MSSNSKSSSISENKLHIDKEICELIAKLHYTIMSGLLSIATDHSNGVLACC